MPIKRAKTLSDQDIAAALSYARTHSQMPQRDRLLIMLTCYAGLRIQEVCSLHRHDFTDVRGMITDTLFVSGRGAKYGKSRHVPLRDDVKEAIVAYLRALPAHIVEENGYGAIFFDRDGGPLAADAGGKQLKRIYTAVGLVGASSHSGRRTFGTRTARLFALHGGTLMDTRDLLGHADVSTTLAYIDPSPFARAVVCAI